MIPSEGELAGRFRCGEEGEGGEGGEVGEVGDEGGDLLFCGDEEFDLAMLDLVLLIASFRSAWSLDSNARAWEK